MPTARASCCSIRRTTRSERFASAVAAWCTSPRSAAVRRAAGRARAAPTAAAPRPAADSNRPLTPSVSVEVTSFAVVDTSSSSTPASSQSSRESRRNSKGAVYRIAPDGLWDQLWESRDDAPYDLTFAADGALIVGTGNKGKIYRLEGDPVRPTLVARGAAQQVTAFYKDARGRTYYATANPGKLFRLSEDRATRGTYESEPRDAQMVSTWGSISWRGVRAPAATRSRSPRVRGTPKRPTTRGARGRPPTSPRTVRPSPAPRPATCSGAPSSPAKARRRSSRRSRPPTSSATSGRRSAQSRSTSPASSFRSRSRPASRSSPASTIRRRRIASWRRPR